MDYNEAFPSQILGCFDIFVRINNISAENFKFVRTHFYNRVYSNLTHSPTVINDVSRLSLRNQKHRYEKVSTPVSCEHIPRFQQKGLIVVWPQRKVFHNREKLTLLSWFLAHAMYFLYIMRILPSANVVAIEKPPWSFRQKLGKPLRRDYIIEPDWDSQHVSKKM